DHVFGYINFIDGSARGVVPPTNVFYQMKSRATFAPIGPYLVTADEVPDPQKLQVKLWVNGQLKQNFNTDDMAHKIPRCIEWVSHIHDLEPGDIIATGTNHRGLSSRTWARETRLERTQKGLEGLTPQLTGKYAKA
ncbi:MAG: fumarylacetoacetate hydrolase, partial [Betaproteobacteria bacterium]|nr:fumarylacetoacetate hydrolase [Betaproteobacteria bacterium]